MHDTRAATTTTTTVTRDKRGTIGVEYLRTVVVVVIDRETSKSALAVDHGRLARSEERPRTHEIGDKRLFVAR